MKLVNVEDLYVLTGCSQRTIKKRCANLEVTKQGRRNLYNSLDALKAILGSGGDFEKSESKGTLESERTRLASAQAEKTELEVEVIKGNLIPSEDVEAGVNNMISAFRLRMLSLPTKVAPEVIVMADANAAEILIREHVYEALNELSEYDAEDYSQDDKQSSESSSSADSPDNKRVGRQRKETVKRSIQ